MDRTCRHLLPAPPPAKWAQRSRNEMVNGRPKRLPRQLFPDPSTQEKDTLQPMEALNSSREAKGGARLQLSRSRRPGQCWKSPTRSEKGANCVLKRPTVGLQKK